MDFESTDALGGSTGEEDLFSPVLEDMTDAVPKNTEASSSGDAPPTTSSDWDEDSDQPDFNQALGPHIGQIAKSLDAYTSLLGVKSESLDFGKDPEGSVGPLEKLQEDLEKVEKTARQLRFHLQFGDYAGRIWNCLRSASRLASKPLPDSLRTVTERLESPALDGGQTLKTLRECIEILKGGGVQVDVNVEMAKVAIGMYATRNLLCHVDNKTRKKASKEDLDALVGLLPDEQKPNREHWQGIVGQWEAAGEWLADARCRTASQSRFLSNAPSGEPEEKEEFKQAVMDGLFHESIDRLYDGGARRPHIPRRTRQSAGSDPVPYVPCKRETTLSPPLSPSAKRKRPSKR
ncbi:uncharacterized protein N7498_004656 [Penicillium cinerascens]|uniref:Uncharacterized protein n=1 Tax=Penicillium cinerascens TaxID=70096 RepID=A0A9W9SZH5_9EURO|nr:uncharacterized protein N7498_004656 [Penicillium cinerascens]KAJ5203777.1 hypothetical protein N7498_004656 [Penicillium cinerascens]